MIPVSDGRNPTRADYCAVACAEAFRGDGEIMVSPMGFIPRLGARLARRTFEPDLLLSDSPHLPPLLLLTLLPLLCPLLLWIPSHLLNLQGCLSHRMTTRILLG